jgi:hypothetical protein
MSEGVCSVVSVPRSGESGVCSESLVSSCMMEDCVYNRQRACSAGAVTLVVLQGKPVCGTYQKRES